MPTGKADTPGCFPGQLRAGAWCLLPESPIGVESFRWVHTAIEAVSWAQIVESVTAQRAVIRTRPSIEEDRAVCTDVCVIGIEQTLNQGDHLIDPFTGTWIVIGGMDVQ